MMAARPFKVLFVCMGNICRSPAAEGVLRKLAGERGLGARVVCDSAGTIAEHSGEGPDARMLKTAAERGITLEHRARKIAPRDFEDFDLILTMDEQNLRAVRENAPHPKDLLKVGRFADYLTQHSDREVPDPYFGRLEGFDLVLDLLEDGCNGLLDFIASGRAPRRDPAGI